MSSAAASGMPWFAPLYPAPPYDFRAARQSWVVYEGAPDAVAEVLPDGVVADSDPPVCAAWACHYPASAFGPYLEAYVVVRVVAGGERYWSKPVIVTDSEAPMAAGREVWGYPKKLAHLTWSGTERGGPGSEQLVMAVERPRGLRLMTLSVQPERIVDPRDPEVRAGLEPLPTLSHRVLPGTTGGAPAVDELVAVDVRPHVHRGADGRPELWRGRGAVQMGVSAADPWHLLAPVRVLDAFSVTSDFSLPVGRVVRR